MFKSKIHIALVFSPPLINRVGGSEYVLCNMANALTQRGFDVSILFYEKGTGTPAYPLDNTVHLFNTRKILNRSFWYDPPFRNIRSLSLSKEKRNQKRQQIILEAKSQAFSAAIQQCSNIDLFIAYEPISTYILKEHIKTSTPVITMLHSTPSIIFSNTEKKYINALQKCSVIQILLPIFANEVHEVAPNTPLACIPNIAPTIETITDLSQKKVISIGRVAPSKRPELLIEAFSILQNDFPDWTCEWWGETNHNIKYVDQVRKLISDKKLENKFFLMGTTTNIHAELTKASIFAFPSEHEGFSIAMAEALAHGLPAIGTIDCTSVKAILENNGIGLLTEPTPESFALALKTLMKDQDLRQRLGIGAQQYAKNFSEDRIWDQWTNLIYKLINPA